MRYTYTRDELVVELFDIRHIDTTGERRENAKQRVARKEWSRVIRGYYVNCEATTLFPDERHLLKTVAVLDSCGERWHATAWSAAVIYGIPIPRMGVRPVALVADGAKSATYKSATTSFKVTKLSDGDLVAFHGHRVTSVQRTLLEIGRRSEFEEAVVAIEHCLHNHLANRTRLEEFFGRFVGQKGMRKARAALDFSVASSESVLEAMSRVFFDRHGIPQPVTQWTVVVDGGQHIYRVDFYWENVRLIGEVDGLMKYPDTVDANGRTRGQLERIRQANLESAGYQVIRWTHEDLVNRPEKLAARIRSKLTGTLAA